MAYADLDAVRSRVGRLAEAWSETSQPSLSQIESVLAEKAGEIDSVIASRGFSVPVADENAKLALVGLNADLALLDVLPGTFPAGSGRAAAAELLADIRRRVDLAWAALVAGSHSAILLLESGGEAVAAGATSYWQTEGAREVRAEYPYGEHGYGDDWRPGRGTKF